jgi:uncharacterized protein YdhG (YjbR/CyaY superfamily)
VKTNASSPGNPIEAYISAFPEAIRARMHSLLETVRNAAPHAEEPIRYGIPTFRLGGNLVHFAAYKRHIGFYPSPSAIIAFRGELSEYAVSKGAVQFPHDKPLPLDLIRRMVLFRVKEAEQGMV